MNECGHRSILWQQIPHFNNLLSSGISFVCPEPAHQLWGTSGQTGNVLVVPLQWSQGWRQHVRDAGGWCSGIWANCMIWGWNYHRVLPKNLECNPDVSYRTTSLLGNVITVCKNIPESRQPGKIWQLGRGGSLGPPGLENSGVGERILQVIPLRHHQLPNYY